MDALRLGTRLIVFIARLTRLELQDAGHGVAQLTRMEYKCTASNLHTTHERLPRSILAARGCELKSERQPRVVLSH